MAFDVVVVEHLNSCIRKGPLNSVSTHPLDFGLHCARQLGVFGSFGPGNCGRLARPVA